MRTFNNSLLIDQSTGEIDTAEVTRSAKARARFAYGVDMTDLDIRYWTEKLTAMAGMLRVQRRRELGLPDDETYAGSERAEVLQAARAA